MQKQRLLNPHALHEARPQAQLTLARLPRTANQHWSLRDRYVELVWVERLGVTTTALARRLELLITADPPAQATSLAALATPLHVPTRKVPSALRRLHHHELVVWREHSGVIGLSGYAPSLNPAAVATLSPVSAHFHRALTADSNRAVSSRAVSPVPDLSRGVSRAIVEYGQ